MVRALSSIAAIALACACSPSKEDFLPNSQIERDALRERGFFILDAEPQNPDLSHPELTADAPHPLGAHRIKPGTGLVVGYRWYSEGDPGAIDDETYAKVTLWLPDGSLSSPEKVWIAICEGGSAWTELVILGPAKVQHLQMAAEAEGHLLADMDITWSPAILDLDRGKRKPLDVRDLKLRLVLEPLELSEVSPWLGSEGEYIYQESYPPRDPGQPVVPPTEHGDGPWPQGWQGR